LKVKSFDLEEKPVKQEDKSRCLNCKRKVGVMGFDCKCQGIFCKNCRMPEKHECDFDFKEVHQKRLEKANPTIKSSNFERV
jgi:hypothetical protein